MCDTRLATLHSLCGVGGASCACCNHRASHRSGRGPRRRAAANRDRLTRTARRIENAVCRRDIALARED